ncbi:hypothetical protein LINPERPRIM_LOCUS38105 [Linum perenne]
MCSWLTS